jgi:hypothetical protein
MLTTMADLAAYLEEGGLEKEWLSAFGVPLRAAVAQGPVSVDFLSKGELARYRSVSGIERRRAWLTGRAALKRWLRRSDLDEDTEAIGFPSYGLSVSSCGGFAITMGIDSRASAKGEAPEGMGRNGEPPAPEPVGTGSAFRGIGLALQAARPFSGDSGRTAFSPGEWAALSGMDGSEDPERRERAVLRALAAKTAVFRADSESPGRSLSGYRLGNPLARKGWAFSAGASRVTGRFQYLAHYLGGWHISVAVLR